MEKSLFLSIIFLREVILMSNGALERHEDKLSSFLFSKYLYVTIFFIVV